MTDAPRCYYNEHDDFAASWLVKLARAGHILPGLIDRYDIQDVKPEDVAGFTEVSLFSGIGGWSLALRLAGWPSERPVWTGSCPCQSFSTAGRGAGFDDPRHLWPHMFRLIRECRPPVVFGEQVSAAIRYGWLDRVCCDLETEGYACAAAVLPACSVGAPHLRQRLFWCAKLVDTKNSDRRGSTQLSYAGQRRAIPQVGGCGAVDAVGDPSSQPVGGDRCGAERTGTSGESGQSSASDNPVGIADTSGCAETETVSRCSTTSTGVSSASDYSVGIADRTRLQGRGLQSGECAGESFVRQGSDTGPWSDSGAVYCRDGKYRRVSTEPRVYPLVARLPTLLERRRRAGLLRGYGNSIVPQVAAVFIRAFLEAEAEQEAT